MTTKPLEDKDFKSCCICISIEKQIFYTVTKWFEIAISKANFPQEAMFFILCHRFFLHSPLFKSCCHTTFEYLSHCWGWASLLERAATAAASQQLTELKFKLGQEASSTQQSCKENWWQTNFKHCFRTYLALFKFKKWKSTKVSFFVQCTKIRVHYYL